jgi:hypothetical protein
VTSGSAGSPGSWPCGCNCRRLNAGPALRRLVDDALADAARSAGAVLALWAVTAVAVLGGQGLLKILPLRWVTRLAALVMVVMAGFTLARRCGNARRANGRRRPRTVGPPADATISGAIYATRVSSLVNSGATHVSMRDRGRRYRNTYYKVPQHLLQIAGQDVF